MSMIFISLPSLYKLIFNSVQQNAGVCGLPADLASKPVLSHLSLLLIFHLCGCCGANLRFPNKILWFLSMSKAYLPSYKFKNCSSGDFFIVINFKILLSFSKRYPLFPLCYRYYHFVYLRIRRFFNTWDSNREFKYLLTDFIGFQAFMRFWNKNKRFILLFLFTDHRSLNIGKEGKGRVKKMGGVYLAVWLLKISGI